MKLTSAIDALTNGNGHLGDRIRQMELQKATLSAKILKARTEWEARGAMLDAMRKLQAVMPNDETIDFVVPEDYE